MKCGAFSLVFTCASSSHFTCVHSDDLHSLLSSRFPPHMVPPHHSLHTTGIPHPAIVTPNVKQESTHSDINSLNSSWVAWTQTAASVSEKAAGRVLIFPPSCPPQETVRFQEGTGEKERGAHKEASERLHALHEGNAGQGGGRVYTEGKRRHQPDPWAEGKIRAGFQQRRTRSDDWSPKPTYLNVLLCVVPAVARPITGGAGQVLRAGQERATASHAAVPGLVSTRQLCKFLSLQVLTACSLPPFTRWPYWDEHSEFSYHLSSL